MRAFVLVLLASCGFTHGALSPDDMPNEAGVIDAADMDAHLIDAPTECMQWTPKHFTACAIPAPLGDLTLTAALSPYKYTTTTGGGTLTDKNNATITIASTQITQTNGPNAALLSVNNFSIADNAELAIVGTKPLIIAAWGTTTIAGTIDAGSHRGNGGRIGGGSAPGTQCSGGAAASAGADEVDTGGGSGGGGGGAFRGNGGMGGPGDSGSQNAGGAGGTGVSFPMYVRGGCSGAKSGKAGPDPNVVSPSDDNTQAEGGAGGGAVQLTSRGALQVVLTARIISGGAGGEGAPSGSAVGGGGGGAGGYVGFDAGTLTIAGGAIIATNGGGAGASSAFTATGNPGNDGSASSAPALGGAAQTCANAGGSGSSSTSLNGADALQTGVSCGGGGGGGGAGFIGVFTGAGFSSGAIFSPAYSLNPF